MSGVLKPVFYDTDSKTPSLGIHIDSVVAFDKMDIPAFNNRPAEYSLTFKMKDGTSQRLLYTTSALRNTAYTNFNTAFATVI